MQTHLLVKDQIYIRSHDLLTLDKVIELLPENTSILIEEVKKKILAKPGKFKQESCFFRK